MASSPKRAYQIGDLIMLQHGQTMLDHFLDDQAAFALFDPQFAPPYHTQWQDAISLCLAQTTDETRLDQQQQQTQEVKDAMLVCRQKFRDLRYFVRLAFAHGPATQSAFGIEKFHRSQYSRLELLQLMYSAYDLAVEHTAALTAVGFDASAINEIKTVADQLKDMDVAQGMGKRGRRSLTHERIMAYNALWNTMRQVSRAAKHVFAPNEARSQLYALPWPKRKAKKPDDTATLQP
jgi:hypothetical protein